MYGNSNNNSNNNKLVGVDDVGLDDASDVTQIENVIPSSEASCQSLLSESPSKDNATTFPEFHQVEVEDVLEKSKNILHDRSNVVENKETHRFEEMDEDELMNEFRKRNMKVGRIRKKTTFTRKLLAYETNAQT